jgi:KaiC/GvpD/RAD55 family RecA-like ATPase
MGSDTRPPYLPEIFNLESLFETDRGFEHGDTVLIAGASGLGRTIIALSMVRDLLRQDKDSSLYYITTEMDRKRLQRRYRMFGWFSDEDPYFSWPRTDIVRVAEVELPQPTRGAAVLIAKALTEIRNNRRGNGDGKPALVIVDSITALLKDSRDPGDRRRNVSELISGLERTIGADHLGLVILTAEQTVSEAPAELAMADFVFQVGLRDTGSGRRLRTLEVTKCHGRYVAMGTHSWAVVSSKNPEGVIAQPVLLEHVKKLGKQTQTEPGDGSEPRWGSVVIFPRPRFPPIGREHQQSWDASETDLLLEAKQRQSTGTPGLDEMLAGDEQYWSRPVKEVILRPPGRCLIPGSTTIILGRSGTGKTIALLQFLLGNEPVAAKGNAEESPIPSLYVNFENRPSRVLQWFPASEERRNRLNRCEALYRRRSNLDFNALVAEVSHVIQEKSITRVAIDGLSDLLATTDSQTYSRMTEDLLISIRQTAHKGSFGPVSVFISLETDAGSTDLSVLEAISFATDNVVFLRGVFVNDEQRKTVHIIKARGQSPDPQIREVIVREGDDYPLRIVPGLENYADLHSANPKPVVVALQLLAENDAELACNKRILSRLRQQYGYPVRHFGFSRAEIVSTLADIATGMSRIPFSDVKLLSIDEWWIRELRISVPRRPSHSMAETPPPLLRLDTCLPGFQGDAARDESKDPIRHPTEFWFFEAEKASALVLRKKEGELESELVALPNYTDFGLFCLNLTAAKKLGLDDLCQEPWTKKLTRIPRQWGKLEDKLDGEWFADPRPDGDTLVDFMHAAIAGRGNRFGYAFDTETPASAACAFLEMCWSFGASEDFLIRDLGQSAEDLRKHPTTIALQFFQFLVVNGLMRTRSTLKDSEESLFSRHWYSSLCHVRKEVNNRASGSAEPVLWPLPFFPVGAFRIEQCSTEQPTLNCCPSAIWHAAYDAFERLRRLIRRMEACFTYRKVDEGEFSKEAATWQRELGRYAKAAQDAANEAGRRDYGQSKLQNELKPMLERCRNIGSSLREKALASSCFRANEGYRWPKDHFRDEVTGAPPIDGEPPPLWQHLAAARWMDVRDVLELCTWHEFRLQLIEAELERRPLASVFGDKGGTCSAAVTALTGSTCEGSWLIGADRKTHSPRLAAKFIAEITSSHTAEDRAELGAGIPARKDFFDHHGDEAVPHLERPEMSWRQFLHQTASRARRRDRVVCSHVRVSKVFDRLDRLVHHALTVAAESRSDYQKPIKKNDVIKTLKAASLEAIQELFGSIRQEMTEKDNERPCLTCPLPGICRNHQATMRRP